MEKYRYPGLGSNLYSSFCSNFKTLGVLTFWSAAFLRVLNMNLFGERERVVCVWNTCLALLQAKSKVQGSPNSAVSLWVASISVLQVQGLLQVRHPVHYSLSDRELGTLPWSLYTLPWSLLTVWFLFSLASDWAKIYKQLWKQNASLLIFFLARWPIF